MYTSVGNLAPNVQSLPHRLKTFKKKKRELYQPMAHKRGFNTCKLCGVIYHNRRYCPADPVDAHKKTGNMLVRK